MRIFFWTVFLFRQKSTEIFENFLGLVVQFFVFESKKFFFENNFSTIETVENVEKFLSKKCGFRKFHRVQANFTHKFSTLSNSMAVERCFLQKNLLFRFFPIHPRFSV